MKRAENNVCPRCLGPVPSADAVGQYPGALSRADNETEVCSDCGRDEALGNGPVPVSAWPIETPTTPPGAFPAKVHGAGPGRIDSKDREAGL